MDIERESFDPSMPASLGEEHGDVQPGTEPELGELINALFDAREQPLTILAARPDFTPHHQRKILSELTGVQEERTLWKQSRGEQ